MNEGQRFRAVVRGDSGSGPMSCGDDQLYLVTCDQVREPGVLTSCPGRIGSVKEGLRC